MTVNGGVPAAELTVIDEHGTRLLKWAAAVWFRAVADARADGVRLAPSFTPPPAPAGLAGYRDYNMQKWLYRHPIGPVPIARPGTSTHGLGNRLDVGAGVAWVAAHMDRYGLWREFSSEPWHFGFRTSLAGLGLTPITVTKGVRIMYRAALRNTKTIIYFDSLTYFQTLQGSADDKAWARYVGTADTLTVSQAEADSYRRVAASNAARLGPPPAVSGHYTDFNIQLAGTASPVPTKGS